MKKHVQKYVINCNIQKVWDFFTDIKHLELLSPEDIQESLLKSTHSKFEKNTEVWTSTKLIRKQIWHSKIIECEPYSFTDQLQEGLFKEWKHVHRFDKISDDQTSITEEVIFELPYGLIGNILEIFVLYKVKSFFDYRKEMTLKLLES